MGRAKSVEQFLGDALAAVQPLDPLNYTIAAAQGCVLADDVVADTPVPQFDEAAVDGYAVRSEDTRGADTASPVKLAVVGEMGRETAPDAVRERQAVRVRRGVALPHGADAVVPVGRTDGGLVTVHVNAEVPAGCNINVEGSDLSPGTTVLKSGDALSASRVGLLASMGRIRVLAHPRPRVVVISLGGDDAGSRPLPTPRPAAASGAVPDRTYDVAGFALTEAVRDAGAGAYRAGILTDSPQELATGILDHLIRADVVVTVGGIGFDASDVVPKAFAAVGEVTFDTLDMGPGGVVGFGFVGPERLPVFCLPGDPVAALVEFEVLVRPVLLRLAASGSPERLRVVARCAAAFDSPAGMREFVGVSVGRRDGEWVALPLSDGRMRLPHLAASHGLMDVPAGTSRVGEGDRFPVMITDELTATGLRRTLV